MRSVLVATARYRDSRPLRCLMLMTLLLLAGLWAEQVLALKGQPKLGPEAVPITQQTEYLRTAPAPDYWTLSPFYLPQQTSSACSLASLAMALNALRGLPARSDERLVTQPALLKKMAQAAWTRQVAEGGSGVTLDGLVALVKKSLARFQLRNYVVEVIRPANEPSRDLGATAPSAFRQRGVRPRRHSGLFQSGRGDGGLGWATRLADWGLRRPRRASADPGRGSGVVCTLLDGGYPTPEGHATPGTGQTRAARRRNRRSDLDQAPDPPLNVHAAPAHPISPHDGRPRLLPTPARRQPRNRPSPPRTWSPRPTPTARASPTKRANSCSSGCRSDYAPWPITS